MKDYTNKKGVTGAKPRVMRQPPSSYNTRRQVCDPLPYGFNKKRCKEESIIGMMRMHKYITKSMFRDYTDNIELTVESLKKKGYNIIVEETEKGNKRYRLNESR